MRRCFISIVAAVATVVTLSGQAARAQDNNSPANWNGFWSWFSHGQDPRLTATGIGVGAASGVASYFLTQKHGNPGVRPLTPLAAYGVTTLGCAAVYPIVGTLVLNRPLTPREAYIGLADCVLPFVGGWIVDASLPHDAWMDGEPANPPRSHYYHHHK
ncbi:MAG TPA: hypothetical protein VGJ20_03555 [Xanthobacteraceae bacterium]|jgi:hypothetical protein